MKAVAVAVVAFAALVFAGGDEGPRIVIRDQGGDVLAQTPLPADGRFGISYRHSVYGVAAEERFRARGDGFELVAIASPSRRVLDYYELDGRTRRDRGRFVLTPRPVGFDALDLAATERGRRTLIAGEERIPLYRVGRHLRIEVTR